MIKLIIAGWLLCGVLGYGLTLAYFQRKYPTIAKENYRDDCGFATLIGITGPVGLAVAYTLNGFGEHGLMYRREQ